MNWREKTLLAICIVLATSLIVWAGTYTSYNDISDLADTDEFLVYDASEGSGDELANITWANLKADFKAETVICESFTIIEPDLAQAASDDIKLKKFCAEAYPYGVTVTAIHINTDGTDISDTFLFEQWDDADGSNQTTLESIALSATDTGEDDGDMSSTDIPADYYLVVNLDDASDDYKHVIITICYTIDPS